MNQDTTVLALQDIKRSYGAVSALESLSLEMRRGELVCLLGPSGCGKTTTLRIIAGFITPTSGRVLIEGHDVTAKPPNRRDVGIVFQNYALFPHLTVAENIAFGLRNIGVPSREREDRVAELLDLVHLSSYGGRFPRELSGGQQQRVAFARALALRPAVLLLDEPFSNLDAQLRLRMRDEVRSLIDRVRITTVFVTHDQEEALAIADRILVMRHGRVEQEGTPHEIYESPATRFVAEFIGHCNLVSGAVTELGDKAVIDGGIPLELAERVRPGPCTLAIRPEHVRVSGGCERGIRTIVTKVTYLGADLHVHVSLGATRLLLCLGTTLRRSLTVGQYLDIAIDAEHVRAFPES